MGHEGKVLIDGARKLFQVLMTLLFLFVVYIIVAEDITAEMKWTEIERHRMETQGVSP